MSLSDYVHIHSGLRQIPAETGEESTDEELLEGPESVPQQETETIFEGFNENLALKLADYTLATIAEDLLQGIQADIQSRADWEAAYSRAADLLGLRMEDASTELNSSGSISKVYHPLLLEAVIRYQSNARAELLPTNGPVKVRDDTPPLVTLPPQLQGMMPPPNPLEQSGTQRNVLAEAFEKDFNHYLTCVAKEYYPDFDRMLFSLALVGCAFRKIYHCPIRRRPVSEFVPAVDLIVSNDATDLYNAARVTHRVKMRHSTLLRMQAAGVYRDVDLGQPNEDTPQIEQKIKYIEGITPTPQLPADHRHTIYECYAELDLPGFEQEDGIPLPYRITIDKDSRQILEIRRNYKEDDTEYKTKRCFVKYGMIPGLGFYDYGYVQILGNTSRALTAIERMLLDAGQFACFPGFLMTRQGQRQVTNQIRVMPGGGHEIDTGGQPINQAIMALPYKEPSMTLMQFGQAMASDGMRLGGSAELPVGEGNAEMPVGTTIALIEQATKNISAIHKRNHNSQQEEFEIMRELFQEDPTALWRFAKNPAHKWQMAQEFSDFNLVPAADPNTPSHLHRIMQAQAIIQVATMPGMAPLFNLRNTVEYAFKIIGVSDIDDILNPLPPPGSPPPPPPPNPQMEAEQMKGMMRQQEQTRELQQAIVQGQIKMAELNRQADIKQQDAAMKQHMMMQKMQSDDVKHAQKVQADTQKNRAGFFQSLMKHHTTKMQIEAKDRQNESKPSGGSSPKT